MLKTYQIPMLALAASAALMLAACGGGGGGGSASKKPPQGGRLSADANVQESRVAAAIATPKAGSVTQSSNVDGDGITTDTVTVNIDENGRVIVLYNGIEAVDTADAVEKTRVEYVLGEEKGTQYVERFNYEGWRAAEFYRSLAENAVGDLPAGDLWVDVYDNFGGTDPDDADETIDETNYLAGGIWVFIPDEGEADDYEFGAFADGGDPFTSTNIAGLTGQADYVGDATGVYSYGTTGGGRRNEFFDAVVTLMADFDDSAKTISGMVHDFQVDGEMVEGDPELMLEAADITADNHGFFTGDTSGTFDEAEYAGTWGGQFYNNGATNDVAPGAVAGTFGAANDDDDTLIGVFGAYKQP